MTDQIQDERQGATSASNAESDSLCEGRFLAQRGLPEPPQTEEADAGQVIHALWTGTKPERDPTPEERDKAGELKSREVEVALAARFDWKNCLRFVECRLWHDIGGDAVVAEFKHSGRFDVCLHDPAKGRAMVLDGKSGWLPVPPPNTNQQLRDLAVLVWMHLGVREVMVNILKPFGRQDTPCRYTEADLAESLYQLEARVRRSNDPASKRTPGEAQCRYCRAAHWGKCPEHSAWLASCLPVVSPPLPMVTADQWTPEQRAVFCERVGTAAKWLEARKDEIKVLLQSDPNAVPGFGLRDGRKMETVTDPQTVFDRFILLGGKTQQFLKAVKVGKGALKDEVREVTQAKGKALDRELSNILAGCTETKVCEPQIEKL